MAASSSRRSSSSPMSASSSSYLCRRSPSRLGSLRGHFGRAQSLPENRVLNSRPQTTAILAYVVSNVGLRPHNYVTQIFPRRGTGNDFFHNERTGFHVRPSDKVKMTIAGDHLYLSGTFEEGDDIRFTFARKHLSERSRWYALRNPATLIHEGCAVASLKGFVYFVGVIRDARLRPRPECTFRFATRDCYGQLREPMWEKMATMGRGASHSTVVAWSDHLFRFGGITYEGEIVNRVERFNSNAGAKGRWRICRSMRTPRAFASSVCVKDDIYVLGGKTDGSPFSLCSVEKYNVPAKQWTFSTRMTVGRSDFGACQFEGDIVIVGGSNQRPTENYALAYVFNEETQQYEFRSELRTPHFDIPTTVDTLRSVERYAVAIDQWKTMEDTTDISNVDIVGTCSVVSF